jgi:hypothetical protein
MRDRLIVKYFAAVKMPCNVHIAITRFHLDQWVRCNLPRDEVFKHYRQMPEVVVFNNAASATRYADKQYYATTKRNSYGMFEENPVKKSTDAELLNIYGEEAVRMQVKPVTVLYQFEGDDALKIICENVRDNDEIYRGYKVTAENKDKLTLEFAAVQGLSVHFTDEVAKRDGCATTVEPLDHEQLTAKSASCTIL